MNEKKVYIRASKSLLTTFLRFMSVFPVPRLEAYLVRNHRRVTS
jgi:hypothetical protein